MPILQTVQSGDSHTACTGFTRLPIRSPFGTFHLPALHPLLLLPLHLPVVFTSSRPNSCDKTCTSKLALIRHQHSTVVTRTLYIGFLWSPLQLLDRLISKRSKNGAGFYLSLCSSIWPHHTLARPRTRQSRLRTRKQQRNRTKESL